MDVGWFSGRGLVQWLWEGSVVVGEDSVDVGGFSG